MIQFDFFEVFKNVVSFDFELFLNTWRHIKRFSITHAHKLSEYNEEIKPQVTQALSSYLMFIYMASNERGTYKTLYGNLLYHEYSLEIKLAKQYCFAYLYSVFSCCFMIMFETTQECTWSNMKRHCTSKYNNIVL